ncbi:MAG TPA: methyltransferase domain-containing protein [Solirubrobacteraceae bacterium]
MAPPADSAAVARWLSGAASGCCNICGTVGGIAPPENAAQITDTAALREGLSCANCGSISRDRALIAALAGMLGEREPLARWSPRRHVRLLETSGYRGHPGFISQLFDHYNLHYVQPPEGDGGQPIDARAGADLQDLQFPDRFFDIVISAEVLEHVPDERAAIREIARVLRPGGHLVLEVPYVHDSERTLPRVHRWHGRDVYLYPPEYHAEDTLVYRIFGRELLADLSAQGLAVAHLVLEIPTLGVTRQTVIVATKGQFVDLGGFKFDTWISVAPDGPGA